MQVSQRNSNLAARDSATKAFLRRSTTPVVHETGPGMAEEDPDGFVDALQGFLQQGSG